MNRSEECMNNAEKTDDPEVRRYWEKLANSAFFVEGWNELAREYRIRHGIEDRWDRQYKRRN